jgi:hypothetical protein
VLLETIGDADLMISTDRPVHVTGFPDTDSRFQCRRILCVLTLDGTDSPTILQAQVLADRSGGELMLLSTVPEVSEGLLYDAIAGSGCPLSMNLAVERIRRSAEVCPCRTITW